jgi:branched-chain amino acid transport system substrate-binding protein
MKTRQEKKLRTFGKQSRVALCAIALAVVIVAACSSDSKTATSSSSAGSGASGATSNLPASIKLGAPESLTGPAAFCGKNEVDGMKLAIKQANSDGTLGSSKVELQVEDDASTSEGGLAAYRKLVESKVSGLLGPCFSPSATAIKPLVDGEKIPEILTTAGGADYADPDYMYRSGVVQTNFAAKTIDVLGKRGIKSVSVIFQNDNQAIVDLWNNAMKPQLNKLGIKLLSEDGVAGTTQDFSAQISSVKDKKPDALGVLVVGGTNVTIVTQARENGITVPVFGQLAMAGSFYITNGKGAVEGSLFAVSFDPSFTYDSSKAFTAAFTAEYGRAPDYAAANGYDAAKRMILAIKAAGSTDPTKIKAALDGLKSMDGAQGPLTFTDKGDVVGPAGVVEVKGGTTVNVPLT